MGGGDGTERVGYNDSGAFEDSGALIDAFSRALFISRESIAEHYYDCSLKKGGGQLGSGEVVFSLSQLQPQHFGGAELNRQLGP